MFPPEQSATRRPADERFDGSVPLAEMFCPGASGRAPATGWRLYAIGRQRPEVWRTLEGCSRPVRFHWRNGCRNCGDGIGRAMTPLLSMPAAYCASSEARAERYSSYAGGLGAAARPWAGPPRVTLHGIRAPQARPWSSTRIPLPRDGPAFAPATSCAGAGGRTLQRSADGDDHC